MNAVTLIGAITRTPELNPAGATQRLQFTVAGSYRIVDQHGEVRNPVFYHNVKLLGASAQTLSEKLKPGLLVRVAARLEYSTWKDKDGKPQSRTEIRARQANLLSDQGRFEVITDKAGGFRSNGGVNCVEIGGNLTRDPNMVNTDTGTKIAKLRIGQNERHGRGPEATVKNHYFDIDCWGTLAERANEELRQGQTICASGYLTSDTRTLEGGTKRTSLVIDACEYYGLERNLNDGISEESLPFDD